SLARANSVVQSRAAGLRFEASLLVMPGRLAGAGASRSWRSRRWPDVLRGWRLLSIVRLFAGHRVDSLGFKRISRSGTVGEIWRRRLVAGRGLGQGRPRRLA